MGFSLLEEEEVDDEAVEAMVKHFLSLVGLEEYLIDRMPDELSGGMQRRVAIARALAARDPQILLYDEPTTGLDPQAAERITDLIVRRRDTMGKTSIMVTHDIADAFKVGNRITMLHEGRVVFDGPAADLDRAQTPFITQFLAPFRKAVAAASTSAAGTGRPAQAPPPPGGTS